MEKKNEKMEKNKKIVDQIKNSFALNRKNKEVIECNDTIFNFSEIMQM